MYKRIKNEDKLIAKWKLKSAGRFYYHVFLWEDQKSFDENTNDNDPGIAAGCVNFAPLRLLISGDDGRVLKKVIPKKMGEVHFIKGKWDMEIVAHELCHALIGRLRHNATLKICDVIQQNNGAEETICYEFGRWVDQIYRKLWAEDPNVDWKKE